ncbi:G-type lectin S-receptor-like serine/threonine-protein kinase LECRK3 [Ricinus communis]|uniref:Receptor-like serine/threonine-protein kinase n=1 Tax=Ricinus communis TaxID=3988 RepID=B9T0N2_RICCO|nr:G-type lectin S-receptor-like serine/threonine-protein kinase LECRK3 [Ricinus communis]EEF30589.1 ATP binding protein, putative [Ricinus communis]|eukprot:XP_002531801.1 G-type lectin S-receptor-like serine/threonine-protein kinase LECRK3 [Ricinus communis]
MKIGDQKLFMASILFFLFLSSLIKAAAQQRQTNISLGSSLTPTKNSSWLSPSGLYAFGFYQQGNGYAVGVFLAGAPQKTVIWTANRDDPPVSRDVTLLFTSDSGFVLQSARGQNSSVSISAVQSAASAALFDSGNFVLYNSERDIIWQSFDSPTDTLLPTQRLQAGDELISSVSATDHSTGIFRLKMQDDGNLVQYPVRTMDTAAFAYWASGTNGAGNNVTLNLDHDGRLYLLNNTGFNIKNITGGGFPMQEAIYIIRIDFDGIFRLYSYDLKENGNWSVLWSSSNDKCDPKGLCGLNSCCVLNDQEAKCVCLPGFAFVSEGNWTAGCERNSVPESCKGDDARNTIRELPNTIWEVNTYSLMSFSVKEDCEKACLEDCNCDAAFFSSGECAKQRLPLRYGRRDLSNPNSALIKVRASTSIPNIIDPTDKKKEPGKGILIVSASIFGFGLLALTIAGIMIYRYHVRAYKRISSNEHIGLSEEVAPLSFTYAELERVTDGFKEEIGRGSFGTVYKGLLSRSQKVVAVKKLERVLADGDREFQTEMKAIGKTHHKNLVRLLGYCNEGPNRLLVYEFMSNGSLSDVLFSPENRPCFAERIEIARNIARGILYLHEECETQIIHCDIKPENILMDAYMCPKISDFGLAKLLKPDQTKTMTDIRGTRGYVAPEWHRKLPVTVKADVYSFGIVLLEITCCRKNVDLSAPERECILVEWVYDCFASGELDKLVGDDEEVDKRQMNRMIKVGLWCTLDEPSLRPSMKKVLLMLEGTVDIPIPPSPTSFLSCI